MTETGRYQIEDHLKFWIIGMMVLFVIFVFTTGITDIEVKGNKTYDNVELTELIFPDRKSRNTFFCLLNNAFGKKENIPFISDYRIDVKSLHKADLIVYEKAPVGCIEYMSQYMYFDKDGIVIEASAEKLPGIPVVSGKKFGHVVIGKKLPARDENLFNQIMNIAQQLKTFGISCDEICFDNAKNIGIKLSDQDISVDLGQDEYIAVKISVLNDMLPEIIGRGLSGKLDLSNYNDREKGNMSSFKITK